jgi:methylated-DNA-[protein]-cysteine S-methyltransferase
MSQGKTFGAKIAESFSAHHNKIDLGIWVEVYIKEIDHVCFGVVCEGEAVLASNFGLFADEVLESFQRMFPSKVLLLAAEPSVLAHKAVSSIKNIYDGEGLACDFALSVERFPPYTQRVLRTVARIPVGYVASYGGVADSVGGGARAVGNAMATNCFAPLVPCHRVVTTSLGLGGYGGGLRIKYELLNREKRGFRKEKQISVEGGVLRVFPVEFVLRKFEKAAARRKT